MNWPTSHDVWITGISALAGAAVMALIYVWKGPSK